MPMNVLAQRFDDVTITSMKVSDHVYMLQGAGGNIGASVGEDGVFIIDDQFAPLSAKIIEALKTLSDKPLKFVANTHFHGDHTGGNINMTKEGAIIIAHQNVRKRMLLPKKDGSNTELSALPIITFNDQMSLFINGENVAAIHVSNAHTDGDTLLYFTESNVLHTGDTYFNGRYPYIDLNSGGSVKGYINAARKGLMLIDQDTKIIPGHGQLSKQSEYKAFLEMLVDLESKITKAIIEGKTQEEIKNDSDITKKYDALGFGDGFINSERIRLTFYQSLKSEVLN